MTEPKKKKRSHHAPGEKKRRVPPGLLRDMRAVYKQPPEKDRGPGQEQCRAFLLENRKEFIGRLAMLEAAHRAASVREAEKKLEADSSGEVKKADEGEARCLEVAQAWLKEFGT